VRFNLFLVILHFKFLFYELKIIIIYAIFLSVWQHRNYNTNFTNYLTVIYKIYFILYVNNILYMYLIIICDIIKCNITTKYINCWIIINYCTIINLICFLIFVLYIYCSFNISFLFLFLFQNYIFSVYLLYYFLFFSLYSFYQIYKYTFIPDNLMNAYSFSVNFYYTYDTPTKIIFI
jgi:hypothetical protein